MSSYAGYGGNDNNDNQFKYYFDIPDKGWAEGKVNKARLHVRGLTGARLSADTTP